jgi:peptidoglycan hydrolase-like protein with peptidoglycan-binding domain
MRAAAARLNERPSWGIALLAAPLRCLLRRPGDSIAAIAAAGLVVAILINALFMQAGPHPAPIFANKAPPAASTSTLRPAEARLEVAQPARPRSETVAEIQRELSRRGFYEGATDGIYGPKTDTAVRDFEQAAGLKASAEPNDALLASITRSNVKPRPVQVPRNDPIAALLAPSARITAVQRALNDFAYGPLNPTGTYDAPTRAAIERFERARKRPVTGQISDQLLRDLAAMTGRPLE